MKSRNIVHQVGICLPSFYTFINWKFSNSYISRLLYTLWMWFDPVTDHTNTVPVENDIDKLSNSSTHL
jgi:hypothetical protein